MGRKAELIPWNPEGSRQPEHRSWQWMNTLVHRRDKGVCQICGYYHPKINTYYNNTFQGWRVDMDDPNLREFEVHHIIPKKDGGTNHMANLVLICYKCHVKTFSE